MRAVIAAIIEEWRRKIGLLLQCDYIRGSQEVGLLTLKVDNKEEAALNLRGLPSMEERAQESAPTIESGIESESDAFLLWKNESNRVEAIDGVAEVAIVDGTVERGREIRKAAPEVTEGEEEQL
ncbi:hypothetical protein BHM03_00004344 [Ensete ventricosum]|nr:hypothetical protein BHM03_00004344 [Ensete ventricosum]